MDVKQVCKDFLKQLQNGDKRVRLIVILGISGIGIIFLSQFMSGNAASTAEVRSEQSFSAEEYCLNLEERLSELLRHMDGAGKTKVMLSVFGSGEVRYLKDESLDIQRTRSGDGTVSEHQSRSDAYLIINGTDGKQVTEVSHEEPKIAGILILCEGGGNPITQEKIIDAVSTLFGISSARVCVSKLV